MELKKYQKRVIGDLVSYLDFLKQTDSLSAAFADYWASKQVPVGAGGIRPYQNIIDGVPHVCYKVPTGGGKTLLACASVRPILDALPVRTPKAVVWLVPSDAILTQTLAALKNPSHLYRQQLNLDFGSRVEVYSKHELLTGQNFNPATVAEQLTVMVLSYDSFRSANKEGRKAFQANGALEPFRTALGPAEVTIDDADETALFQVINQLEPLVIVDESHHARSDLSKEMLRNFNPSFVLDLTATPKSESNIISYVDALALKAEHMVKLPVVVYNKESQTEVITDAIDIRRVLERAAAAEFEAGGEYIRPIVLFQAQPKASEDATSFEKLRAKLIDAGVPDDQIAIKTANLDELKSVDLLSDSCPVRFIITVNALKEGWDCPFAYVLASLANKTSQVDVEQILGRILRQPHTKHHANGLLNTSYVLTSSNDFRSTIDNVVAGLNAAGFTARDYRLASQLPVDESGSRTLPTPTTAPTSDGTGAPSGDPGRADEDFLEFDIEAVSERIGTGNADEVPSSVEDMVRVAEQAGEEYERKAEDALEGASENALPADLEDKVPHYAMSQAHSDQALALRLPRFYVETDDLFASVEDESRVPLSPAGLTEGFSLKGRDSNVDVAHAVEQIVTVDVRTGEGDRPKAFAMNTRQQQELRRHFDSLPMESRVRESRDMIFNLLDKKGYNSIPADDLRNYVHRVVENLDGAQLKVVETSPHAAANRIRSKIDLFLVEHRLDVFEAGLDDGSISVRPTYKLPERISLTDPNTSVGGSLYEAEGNMNGEERDLVMKVAALENVAWWHRVVERAPDAFCINGPINHYPDFIVYTKSGKIVLVESKGEMLKNDDSRAKIELGEKWANAAGGKYRYYMVFQDGVQPLAGGFTVSDFLSRLERL
ncbi:restriction endonuclease [Microbacterium testaceum]|uniref:Restriction endonuclease n=1 Tax=Microbacterium testaceum TaxID=2033 RepID=A0A147EZA9_MICTE|nr:DEAD/DEAH box helicase family protein [Microbacterium testaceum]KTR95666.1 restriction endonuclease [Microbacterium testaceum]